MSSSPGENTPHAAVAGAADIAVVIPTYNRRTATVRALESVRAQTLAPCAVIVVDDGSTDGTAAHVSDWAVEGWAGASLQVHTQANGGESAARNAGLERIPPQARYVAFLDSDDEWPRDFLARTRAAFEAGSSLHRPLVAVSVDLAFVGGQSAALSLKGMGAAWMLHHGCGFVSSTLIRRDVLAGRPWNEALRTGPDLELFLELSLKGSWGHLTGEPVRIHRDDAAEGEVGNKSANSPRNALVWARIVQTFVDAHADTLPKTPGWTHRVALNWWLRAQPKLCAAELWQDAAEAARQVLAHVEALERLGGNAQTSPKTQER